MIKLKTCFHLFVMAVIGLGAVVTVYCLQATQDLPWWFHALGVILLVGPFLVMALFAGSIKNILDWCDRYDQERDDERFLKK